MPNPVPPENRLTRALRLDDDQIEGVEWAVRCGLHELRNDGFPNADPAKSNIPILESVLEALTHAR